MQAVVQKWGNSLGFRIPSLWACPFGSGFAHSLETSHLRARRENRYRSIPSERLRRCSNPSRFL